MDNFLTTHLSVVFLCTAYDFGTSTAFTSKRCPQRLLSLINTSPLLFVVRSPALPWFHGGQPRTYHDYFPIIYNKPSPICLQDAHNASSFVCLRSGDQRHPPGSAASLRPGGAQPPARHCVSAAMLEPADACASFIACAMPVPCLLCCLYLPLALCVPCYTSESRKINRSCRCRTSSRCRISCSRCVSEDLKMKLSFAYRLTHTLLRSLSTLARRSLRRCTTR